MCSIYDCYQPEEKRPKNSSKITERRDCLNCKGRKTVAVTVTGDIAVQECRKCHWRKLGTLDKPNNGLTGVVQAVQARKRENPHGFFTSQDLRDARTAEDRSKPKPVEQIVRGFITPGATLLIAKPKIGKTTLIHSLLVAISQGTKALGKLRTKRLVVSLCFGNPREKILIDTNSNYRGTAVRLT